MAEQNYSLEKVFGGKDSEAYKSYKQGQKEGKWSDYNDYVAKGGNSSSTAKDSIGSNIERFLTANRQAIAPSIKSYSESIPETRNAFETQRTQLQAEKTPLTERFENLINEVKGGFQRNREQATTTTNNELGRRGILGSSGVADRELQNAVSPINAAESSAIKDIGFERESQLRNLENLITNSFTDETGAIRNILNAMAGLQSNAGMASIPQALSLYNTDLSTDQFNKQFEQSINQFNKTFDLNKQQVDYATNKPYYSPNSTTDPLEIFKLLFPNSSTSSNTNLGATPQYTPARNGIVEGNFISQNGSWVPRYEVVY